MNDTVKAISRKLLDLSYSNGFGVAYPLTPIAEELGIEAGKYLYDANTETGLLWGIGDNGSALITVGDSGEWASVNLETRDILEAWSH